MHPADIKAALQKKKRTQADVARKLSVRPTIVCQVIHGTSRSRRVARHLAELIGRPVSEIWPGCYPKLEIEEIRGLPRKAA